jgi:hypothetical protein
MDVYLRGNNFVNPLKGDRRITCSAPAPRGSANFTTEKHYLKPKEFLQFLS